MNLPLTERLAYQQAKIALIVGVLVGLLLGAIQIVFDYEKKRASLKETLDSLIEFSVEPARDALWNLDESLARSVIRGLFTYDQIVEVRIESERSLILAAQKKAPEVTRWHDVVAYLFGEVQSRRVALTVDNRNARKVIGYLVVVADPSREGVEFIERSQMVLIFAILRSLVLAAILFLVFYRTLTRPIKGMAQTLGQIDLSTLKGGVRISAIDAKGELRLLFEQVNALLEKLGSDALAQDDVQRLINAKNVELEAKVRERTLELKEARDRADRASLAKSAFLVNISSSLRTPLTSIVGLSEVAANVQEPEKLRTFFVNIHSAASALVSTIDDVVDLVQLETRKLKLNPSLFNIHTLKSELENNFREVFEVQGLVLEIQTDPLLPVEVSGDYRRLKQVLVNLIWVAETYVRDGRIHVSIDFLQENAEQTSVLVRFEVRFSGDPVQERMLSIAEDMYEHVDLSGARNFRNVALSLFVSQNFLKLMGSHLEISNEKDHSSLYFRVALSTAEARKVETEVLHPPERFLPDELASFKVLVVEDIELNRLVVEEMLNEIGVSCDFASNGQEAVQKVKEDGIDLVLMDLQMPVMDGFEATMIIRNQLENQGLPIVALTANVLEEDKEHALQCGMNDFIGKPVDFQELQEKVLFWLSRCSRNGNEEKA